MKVEHKKVSFDKLNAEEVEIVDKLDKCTDLLEEFLNINQFSPHTSMMAFINSLPLLAKIQGMDFQTYKTLLTSTMDAFENVWNEL